MNVLCDKLLLLVSFVASKSIVTLAEISCEFNSEFESIIWTFGTIIFVVACPHLK